MARLRRMTKEEHNAMLAALEDMRSEGIELTRNSVRLLREVEAAEEYARDDLKVLAVLRECGY